MDATQDPHEIEYIVDLTALLELCGAATDEDSRVLNACRLGAFDAIAFDPARLSSAFAKAIASDSDYAIYDRARASFEILRSRDVWSRTVSAETVAELSRYARWMQVAAQAARSAADLNADSDYAFEAEATDRFAEEAVATVAGLIARNGKRGVRILTRAFVTGLPAALAARVACEAGSAARHAREVSASLACKLHGLYHVALSARIAQVGRAAS